MISLTTLRFKKFSVTIVQVLLIVTLVEVTITIISAHRSKCHGLFSYYRYLYFDGARLVDNTTRALYNQTTRPLPFIPQNNQFMPVVEGSASRRRQFHFFYPINVENACDNRKVKVVMPVHSAVTNFKRRDRLRNSEQAKFVSHEVNQALMLFFVGLPPSDHLQNTSGLQQLLEKESQKHGDIIQIYIQDTYHNRTAKSLGALNWILTYCPKSTIILKTDDYSRIKVPYLLSPIFERMKSHEHFVIGDVRLGVKPHRNPKDRWYLSVEEFPNDTFPEFALGHAVGYPTSTARLLYQQALKTNFLRIEDLFLTGICRQSLDIPIFTDRNFYMKRNHRPSRVAAKSFVT